jgi:hypothetical protein
MVHVVSVATTYSQSAAQPRVIVVRRTQLHQPCGKGRRDVFIWSNGVTVVLRAIP